MTASTAAEAPERHVHAIRGVHTWESWNQVGGRHECYFCTPNRYPDIAEGCTLCARCGVLIWTGQNDPRNLAMEVCDECLADIESAV